MYKEQRDGLFMDNSVFIVDEKKPGFPIQSRVIQMLAILIGSWSSMSILLESIPVPAKVFSVDLTILLCAGIMFTLCLIPSLDAVKIFFGILFYALFFYSRFPKLQNGFYIMENTVIDRLSSYYNYQNIHFIANDDTGIADTTLLIIMIVIPIVTLLTISIVRNRFSSVTSIILFLPIAISFLFGLIPSEKYLITFVAAILYLTRSGNSSHYAVNEEQRVMIHKINSRAAVWLSLLSILLFFFLKLFISEEKYEDIEQIDVMKTEIQTKLLNFNLQDVTKGITNIKFPSLDLPAGGLDGGKLGKAGQVEFTESEQLRITAPLQELAKGIYLKGYVGSVYTGDSWDGHLKAEDKLYNELLKEMPEDKFNPVNQTANFIKTSNLSELISTLNSSKVATVSNLVSKNTLSIEYKNANKKYLYAPYFTDFSAMDNINYEQDLYAAPDKKKNAYTLEFYDVQGLLSGINLLDIIKLGRQQRGLDSRYQEPYLHFVQQAYTQLPETGLERLKLQCAQVIADNPSYGIAQKTSYVMNYLASNTSYTLSPGKLPKGEDYVEYFLYESKKGYCAHYATAAALMLRALGVPARYAEGYAVAPSDVMSNTIISNTGESNSDLNDDSDYMVEVSVKDYNAHAWVEIYVDYIGWIPVDFTPSSFTDYTALNDATAIAPVEITPTPTVPTPTPQITKPLEDDTKPVNADPVTPSDAENAVSKDQKKLDALFLIIFIVLLMGTVALAVTIFMHRKHKIQNTENLNKRAIFLFTRIERILATVRGLGSKGSQLEDSEEFVKEHCTYIDTENFTSFMETVRKARYGRGRITPDEFIQVELFHKILYEKVNRELTFPKKILLKVLLSV